jgi:eukaryotic-like serine/threonine-protein kinase
VRQYDRAIATELNCLRRQPKSFFAHTILGWAYEQKRMFREAVSELRDAVQLADKAPFALSAYAEALAESGDRRGATVVLTELERNARTGYVSAYDIALIYAALGDRNRAFAWLDKAQAERSAFLPYITWDRRADSLRPDPRFGALLQRLGLTQPGPVPARGAGPSLH